MSQNHQPDTTGFAKPLGRPPPARPHERYAHTREPVFIGRTPLLSSLPPMCQDEHPHVFVYTHTPRFLTLLFSPMPRRDMFCFFLPAVLVSLISGGVAPFMTIAVGEAFDAFAKFPLSDPAQEDKDKPLRSVRISALTLLGLAATTLVLSSITSSLWITTGERNVRALRRCAYHVITNKEMV